MVKTTKRKSNIKRPVRQKKSDVMIHGRTSVAAKMCDVHLARLQRAVDDMDKKWGIDRWMELASASMADKWQGAYNKMMEFVDKEDVEKVSTWVDGCIRGHFRAFVLPLIQSFAMPQAAELRLKAFPFSHKAWCSISLKPQWLPLIRDRVR